MTDDRDPSAAVEHIADETEDHPAEADPPGERVLDEDHEERDARCDPAEDGEERPVDPAEMEVRARAVADGRVRLHPKPDQCGVGDREGERRAEGVQRPDEVDVSREEDRDRSDSGEEDQRQVRRLEPGWNRRNTSGIWRYVAIEYVMREAPMIPAFVAMKRIVAASTPT